MFLNLPTLIPALHGQVVKFDLNLSGARETEIKTFRIGFLHDWIVSAFMLRMEKTSTCETVIISPAGYFSNFNWYTGVSSLTIISCSFHRLGNELAREKRDWRRKTYEKIHFKWDTEHGYWLFFFPFPPQRAQNGNALFNCHEPFYYTFIQFNALMLKLDRWWIVQIEFEGRHSLFEYSPSINMLTYQPEP